MSLLDLMLQKQMFSLEFLTSCYPLGGFVTPWVIVTPLFEQSLGFLSSLGLNDEEFRSLAGD